VTSPLLGLRRVLHIGKYFAPRVGGIERFLEDLMAAQRASGMDSFAIVHGDPKDTFTTRDPSWLRRVSVMFELAFTPIAPRFLFELNRALNDWQPDYLHLHLPNASAFWVLFSRQARRRPWVLHWHSDVVESRHSLLLRLLYPVYRPFERALLERGALIVATSYQYLCSSQSLVAFREKCVVVPLGIDLMRLPVVTQPHSARQAVNAEANPDHSSTIRLIAMGRLTYYKGFDTLIRAVAQCPYARLSIIGSGPELFKLRALIQELSVTERVELLGQLSDIESSQHLSAAEIFCLPSRERTEAFGLVLLEAMFFKLPLLVSAIPGSGVLSVVRPGVNGEFAPVDDPAGWCEAIERLARSKAYCSELAQAGHKIVRTEYSMDQAARALQRVVERTLMPDAPTREAHERPLVVIPARDESATIGAVVAAVRAAGYLDVLVVDDLSDDATSAVARAAGAIVVRAPLRQGAWGAMQTGIRYAVRHNFSSVVTMDADGQHIASEVDKLMFAAGSADVVIGACPDRGSAARRFAWALFRRMTGFEFRDLTSGFRLYNSSACSALAAEPATLIDYQDIGVLLLLQRTGLRLAEVDVLMMPRRVGYSRIFHSWWAVLRYMAETVVLCVSRRNFRAED
jgi:glycosyltransferase involved in cell wall biosynthesis